MFGKRSSGNTGSYTRPEAPSATAVPAGDTLAPERPAPRAAPDLAAAPIPPSLEPPPRHAPEPVRPPAAPAQKASPRERGENYYDTKSQVFSALIDTIDLSQLAKLDADSAREEIRDIVNDIVAIKNFAMSDRKSVV